MFSYVKMYVPAGTFVRCQLIPTTLESPSFCTLALPLLCVCVSLSLFLSLAVPARAYCTLRQKEEVE